MILGLDPGPIESALLFWNGSVVLNAIKQPNDFILRRLYVERIISVRPTDRLVIEKIASFGMAVGESVFETCYWSGRFAEAFGVDRVHRITRIEVKNHICHSSRAKDSNIRQALIDRFGVVGTKRNPGPLFGLAGDLWSSLAVAVTFWDQSHVNTAPTGLACPSPQS